MQVFTKTGFTAIIQVNAMALALRVACTFQFINILFAIGIMIAAFGVPSIMCARAFPILVHMEKNADLQRRVTEIREVTGCVHGEIQSHLLFKFTIEDNIYEGDTCVQTKGTFRQLEPISQSLVERMLKKGARRSELQQFLEVEHGRP